MTEHKTTTNRPYWETNGIDRVMNTYKKRMIQKATVVGFSSDDFEGGTMLDYKVTDHYFYFLSKKRIIKGRVTGMYTDNFMATDSFRYVVTAYCEKSKRYKTYRVKPSDLHSTMEEAQCQTEIRQ